MSNYQVVIRRDYSNVEVIEIDPYKLNLGLVFIRSNLQETPMLPDSHEAVQAVYDLLKSISGLITQ